MRGTVVCRDSREWSATRLLRWRILLKSFMNDRILMLRSFFGSTDTCIDHEQPNGPSVICDHGHVPTSMSRVDPLLKTTWTTLADTTVTEDTFDP